MEEEPTGRLTRSGAGRRSGIGSHARRKREDTELVGVPPMLDAAKARSTIDRWLQRAPGAALMGPFREPWEFGYLMVDPAAVTPPRSAASR